MPALVQTFATRCERGRGTGRADSGYPYSNIAPHLPAISVAQFSLHVPLSCVFDTQVRTAFFSHHFDSWAGVQQVTLIDLESEGIHVENTTKNPQQRESSHAGVGRHEGYTWGQQAAWRLARWKVAVMPERKRHCQKPEGSHNFDADFLVGVGLQGW